MNSEDLTKEDLDILIEAMTAWEEQDVARAMTSSLLGIMLAKDKEEAKSNSTEAIERGITKKKEKSEIATCLKAKLILIKSRRVQ